MTLLTLELLGDSTSIAETTQKSQVESFQTHISGRTSTDVFVFFIVKLQQIKPYFALHCAGEMANFSLKSDLVASFSLTACTTPPMHAICYYNHSTGEIMNDKRCNDLNKPNYDKNKVCT